MTFSQSPEGIPFIKNYSPKEYDTSPDNWAIAQDQRGVMYFGNASGVLQYDGTNWTLIPVSNNSLVRSIAIDANGTIFIGAVGEFGFLSPNEEGTLAYHSLVHLLPENEREFGDVWKIYATSKGVFFQTFTKLIRLSGNSVKIWKPKTSFHFSFLVDNELFINERDKGLEHLAGDKLLLINGGGQFNGIRIYGMLPWGENKILVATREKGLLLLDKKAAVNDTAFCFGNPDINHHLINDQVYGAVKLGLGHYAFATLKNGVIVTNEKGEILQILNKENGLQDDIVKFIYTDDQQDLWIALRNGISRAEISSPLTFINDGQGLKGSIEDVRKFKNSIYAATSLGVFSNINRGSTDAGKFHPLQGIEAQTWSLLDFSYNKDSFLLASSEAGIFKIENTTCSLLQKDFGYFLYQSLKNRRRVFVGMADGLSSMLYDNGKWISEGYVKGIDKEIRSITEDTAGNLWLGTPFDGLIQIHFDPHVITDSLITAWQDTYSILSYDTTSGLPQMTYNIPYRLMDKMIFATEEGMYEFDDRTNHFSPSSFLRKKLQFNQIYRFVPAGSDTVWMFTVAPGSKETGIAFRQKDQSYSWYTKPFGKIRDSEIHAIFPDKGGLTWLGGPDGLFRYDSHVQKDFSKPFYALLHSVTIGKDSIIFGGNFYTTRNNLNIPLLSQPDLLKPVIQYSYNSLRFEYATTCFGNEKSNTFNIYLEGYDNDWSGWSTKTLKEYTNLKEGSYTFHVKANNIYGTESISSSYSFTILPPWYRTIWAYVFYIAGFIFMVYLVVQLSVRRLKQAKVQLEKTVKERTAEVVKQKEEIEVQKQIVEHKNKDITDSINYAQRIQRSLLASDLVLKKNLPDHFIFFRPKDIVSGDFYWASTLANGHFALVTADSTGHGVPGAIMSMLNISCLNEAVNGQKLTAPNEILNYTRRRIIEHLSNDGSAEGGKDGMDCSLVSFDFKVNELTYSAANNPVWIVRDRTILEFSPDKMPVGKHDNDSVSFRQHTIQLHPGDVVYLLTDGMPDQFGGPKGKKFMYRQLKELLTGISQLPMEKQKDAIDASLSQWKGELEQVDDICIIGVSV